jgi:RHS repeat-associated protein
MGFAVTNVCEKSRQGKHTSSRKTASGDFFQNPNRTRLANRRQPLRTRLGNASAPTKTASGVLYYGYRYYDPTTGRWPSRDPIGEQGGLNVYGFISNNPASTVDYMGLRSIPNGAGTAKYTIGITDPKTKRKSTKLHTVKYSFGLVTMKDCKLAVVIPIHFVTAAQTGMNQEQKKELRRKIKDGTLAKDFKRGIDRAWNKKFKLCCNCDKCPDGYELVVGIKIVKTGGWSVALSNNPNGPNSNQLVWKLAQGAGVVAAHEIGHMLGAPDEYLGPIRIGNKWVDYKTQDGGSVMVKETGGARARHFGKVRAKFKAGGCRVVGKNEKCKK